MSKKKIILVLVIVLVGLAAVLAVTLSSNDKEETKAPATNQEQDITTENAVVEKQYTPTFMYFVSDEDKNKEETDKMLEELKSEYEGKVNFDVRNITETPEDGENFPVKGATPAVIMLNTSNDICAMQFMCNDKAELKEIIDAALE